jgi:hypothetical protein
MSSELKKLLLTGIAALFLATAHAGDGDNPLGDFGDGWPAAGIYPVDRFTESFPPLGYPRFCFCMGEGFMFPAYCILDVSKIPSTCRTAADDHPIPIPSIEKYAMRCGDIEATVTVKHTFDDRGRPFNKIDIYLPDPKMIKQSETKRNYLYLNGNLCIPSKIWFCPETAQGVC